MTHYADFVKHYPMWLRARSLLRAGALFMLSLRQAMQERQQAVYFTCYHHVFEDERLGFDRQLRYMRRYGEFIGLADAVALLRANTPIDGRYLCMTFDDGYHNCLSNALPILQEHACPAAFFIVSELADQASQRAAGVAPADPAGEEALLQRILGFAGTEGRRVPFLSWADCRQLQQAGMTIAPHTRSHRNLALLPPETVRQEMEGARADIQQHLGVRVPHIACPVGRPGVHFRPDVEPVIAEAAGFQSFFTLERGPNCQGSNPFRLKREHLCAGWGNFQIHYFLSQPCPRPAP
ncbi:MAG: polysaccharide deacetylase family protein [Magnetococcales bacterium]|nr:polysaccharide deacetylase family protein [Magnetococcales bacterium]